VTTDPIAISGVGEIVTDGDAVALGELPSVLAQRAGRVERVSQLALVAGHRALRDAGLEIGEGPPRPGLGVALGTALGCFLTNAAHQRRLIDGGPASASPRLFAATVSNAAAGELTIALRLGGPNVTLTAGVASGLAAMAHGAGLLRRGQAAAMLSGGMDALGDPVHAWLAQGGLRQGRRRAMEGAAVFVLETHEASHARRAPSRGWMLGWGIAFDASGDGGGRATATAAALDMAGVRADEIEAFDLAETQSAEPLAAGGPLRIARLLGSLAPGSLGLVADVCSSGHAAAILVRRAVDARGRIQ